uniref:Uncharacterized protein n=1 Tax=Leersia perrieri TaxID=77586 RepID=A0A0D9W7Z2_9ORYZ
MYGVVDSLKVASISTSATQTIVFVEANDGFLNPVRAQGWQSTRASEAIGDMVPFSTVRMEAASLTPLAGKITPP